MMRTKPEHNRLRYNVKRSSGWRLLANPPALDYYRGLDELKQ